MEITCQRCHQTLHAENCYCPSCGLPQLVYTTDDTSGPAAPERWTGAVLDASMVNWKPAVRAALLLAVPAGLLTSGISPVGMLGLFWMAGAAAWAVNLYVRSQRPAWITMGAGARIGLVTGLLAGWMAFTVSGGALFVQRYVLHQTSQLDSEWKTRVDLSQQMTEQLASDMGVTDKAQEQAQKAWMMSPEGHAGIETFGFASSALFLLLFAAGGGALGARMLARSRRPEI